VLGKGEEEVNRYWLIVERSDILAIGGINGYSLMVNCDSLIACFAFAQANAGGPPR